MQNDSWSSIDKAKIGISKLRRKVRPEKYKTFILVIEDLKEGLNTSISGNISGVECLTLSS